MKSSQETRAKNAKSYRSLQTFCLGRLGLNNSKMEHVDILEDDWNQKLSEVAEEM